MKFMKYPRGLNSWVPSIIRNIEVCDIRVLRHGLISKKGFRYDICEAKISEEDATYLILKIDKDSPAASIKFSSKSFINDKYS